MNPQPNGMDAPDDDARRRNDRRGIALITALFCIVVIALVISGAWFTSTQEFRGTRNELVEQRAFAIAEFGLNSEISNWDRSRNLPGGMAVGAIDSTKIYPSSGDTAWVKVQRLGDNTFWVTSDGEANIGRPLLESRRQTNAYVRIAYPSITPKGAITAAGDVTIKGSAMVDGDNQDPPGWTQCASIPGTTVPAVVVPPGKTVDYKPGNIGSTPAVVYDAAAADSNTYVRYGSESWNSLTSNADVQLPGGVYGTDIAPDGTASTCNTGNPLNWGEPLRGGSAVAGCLNYFPIVYSASSLHINGKGRGQGILLVNGDLQINGQFEWYGLVVVRDDLNKGNGTAKIQGAVYAANTNLGDPTWVNGNQDVFYSKCAAESALRGSAILVRVKERGWAQIY